MLLGVLKPAILATDVHLSQLPQSLSEMRNHYQGSFHAGSQSSFVVIDRYTPAAAVSNAASQNLNAECVCPRWRARRAAAGHPGAGSKNIAKNAWLCA
jgi:hypothetical protein